MSNRTAWIVDDDPEIRNAMRLMMKLLGYELKEFKDVPNVAASLTGGLRPDILFLDINMPGVTGVEFLAVLRMQEVFADLPILIISSETAEQRVEQVLRLGADGYVFKPVMIDELETAMRTAVERRKAALARKGEYE